MKKKPQIQSSTPKEKKPFFKAFTKAFHFLNRFVPEDLNKSTGVYLFGKNNRLPNQLLAWVLDSGTAKRATTKRSAYIAADGFIDEKAANFQVNPTQTADKLLTEIAGYQTYFKGFALQVKRKGTQFETKVLPFQDIRKREDGTFVYNPTWSAKTYDRTKDQIIQPFLGKRAISTDELGKISNNGELIYAYHKSADNPQYPIPDYYAGIEDIRTNSEIQKLDFECATNGFMPSAILTLIGGLDDETEDEAGMTEKDYFDESLLAFTGTEKDSEGNSQRFRLMVINARNKEEVPTLQSFDAKSILEASNSKRDIIDRAVCRLFGVPPPIAGFADPALLGNTQAMANCATELNNDVISDQQLITETMAMIYPEIPNWDITTFRPIQFIPPEVFAKLTDTEIRALGGYPELEVATTDEKILADVLGVGGTQSLTDIIIAPALSAEQKKAALEILFGLTPEDASRLVAGAVEPVKVEEVIAP